MKRFLLSAFLAVSCAGCGSWLQPGQTGEAPSPSSPDLPSGRTSFAELLSQVTVGMDADQVMALLGKPYWTCQHQGVCQGCSSLFFETGLGGSSDRFYEVWLRDGKVEEVLAYSGSPALAKDPAARRHAVKLL